MRRAKGGDGQAGRKMELEARRRKRTQLEEARGATAPPREGARSKCPAKAFIAVASAAAIDASRWADPEFIL